MVQDNDLVIYVCCEVISMDISYDVCVHKYIYITHTYKYTCIRIHMCTHTQCSTYKCTLLNIYYICKCKYMCKYKYIFIYIIHTWIYNIHVFPLENTLMCVCF